MKIDWSHVYASVMELWSHTRNWTPAIWDATRLHVEKYEASNEQVTAALGALRVRVRYVEPGDILDVLRALNPRHDPGKPEWKHKEPPLTAEEVAIYRARADAWWADLTDVQRVEWWNDYREANPSFAASPKHPNTSEFMRGCVYAWRNTQ